MDEILDSSKATSLVFKVTKHGLQLNTIHCTFLNVIDTIDPLRWYIACCSTCKKVNVFFAVICSHLGILMKLLYMTYVLLMNISSHDGEGTLSKRVAIAALID